MLTLNFHKDIKCKIYFISEAIVFFISNSGP